MYVFGNEDKKRPILLQEVNGGFVLSPLQTTHPRLPIYNIKKFSKIHYRQNCHS